MVCSALLLRNARLAYTCYVVFSLFILAHHEVHAATMYDVQVYGIRTYSTKTGADIYFKCKTSSSYISAWIYAGKTNSISSSSKYGFFYNGVSGSPFRMSATQTLYCQFKMTDASRTYFTTTFGYITFSNLAKMSTNRIWLKNSLWTQSGRDFTVEMYYTVNGLHGGSVCATNGFYPSSNCASGKCIDERCCTSSVISSGCTSCSATGVCDQCKTGYYLSSSNCYAKKSSGGSCSGSSQCTSGYCRGGRCCSSSTTALNCASCSTSGSCSQCNTGYEVNSGKCTVVLKSSGATCSANSECSSNACKGGRCCGSTTTGGTGCNDCSSGGACEGCSSGYYLSQGNCIAKSTSGGSCSSDNHCLSGTCWTSCCTSGVSSKCTKCSSSDGSCIQCSVGYVLSSGQCNPLKDSGASCSLNNECASNTCLSSQCCHANADQNNQCTSCSNSNGYCTSCNAGYAPNRTGYCTNGGSACTSGSQCSSSLCLNTNCCSGVHSSGTCSSCSPTTGECNGCASGYYLDAGSSTCLEPKSDGSSCTTNSECSSGSCSGGVCAKGSVTSSPGSNSNVQSAEDNEDDGDIVPGCNLWCLVGVIAAVLVVAGLIALVIAVRTCTKEKPKKPIASREASRENDAMEAPHTTKRHPMSDLPIEIIASGERHHAEQPVQHRAQSSNSPYPNHTPPVQLNSGTSDPFVPSAADLNPARVPEKPSDRHSAAPEVPIAPEPPTRCFKRAPQCTFAESIERLLAMPVPPNRPDCQSWVPDEDDAAELLHFVQRAVPEVKARPRVQALQAAIPDLSDDDLRMLIAYKAENPYPMYRWLNAWLTSSRRDPDVVSGVGPAFTRLYRALEKLPPVTAKASRAVIVHEIPALKATFENYNTRLASGMALNFWGFSSFSTDDEVMNSAAFMGKPQDEAIIYTCPELTGVDMEPFKPAGAPSEEEILPLAPAIFTVVSATKIHSKVTVVAMQQPNSHCAYVAPAASKSFVHIENDTDVDLAGRRRSSSHDSMAHSGSSHNGASAGHSNTMAEGDDMSSLNV